MTTLERVTKVAEAIEWVRRRGGWIQIFTGQGMARVDFGVPYTGGSWGFGPEETDHEIALIACPDVVAFLLGCPAKTYAPARAN